jgi:hypothetical protein
MVLYLSDKFDYGLTIFQSNRFIDIEGGAIETLNLGLTFSTAHHCLVGVVSTSGDLAVVLKILDSKYLEIEVHGIFR